MTRTYDDAGNMLQQAYDTGLTLNFTYDPDLDRLLTADHIAFTYDAEGRITSTTNYGGAVFGATYDNGGRLTHVTYAGSALEVTYSYDPGTGMLTRITDNLTSTQIDFTYDDDLRLTGVLRSNGVLTTNTWDDAGRLTGIQHGTLGNLDFDLDETGQITSVTMTGPLSPAGLLTDGDSSLSFDAGCQASTAGYGYDGPRAGGLRI